MLIDGLNLVEGSTNTNLVIPNVTVAQRAALTDINTGELIFVTDGAAPGLFAWSGTAWVPTKDEIDLTAFYTKTEVDTALALKAAAADLAAKANSADVTTSLAAKEDTANKGVANGYASLDSNAKVPTSLIPDAILGQLEYQGVRDMTVALPAASAANKGYYYVTTTSGNGYVTGDWAVSNGASWDKVDNTDAVQSVAGRTGAVTLTTADLTDFATAVTTPLAAKVGLTTVNTVTNRVQDGDGNLRSIPQVAKTASYTLTAADNGKNINITTGGVVLSNALAAGDVVSIYNQSSAAQNISWSGLTVYLAGTSAAKSSPLSLSARGVLTAMYVSATEIVVSGNV
jgi:hypothetical protein